MEIGAQLYTVRNQCKTLEGLAETLKKVAEIGYPTVQISGTCGFEPEWMAEQLKKNGLRAVLTHNPEPQLISETEQLIKNHDVFGCGCIGLGWYSFTTEKLGEDLDEFVRKFTPAAKLMAEQGKYFMYHNHVHEFQKYEGKTVLEHLAERMPKELMGFTLDTFWVQAGGADPARYLEKLAGRVPCIHLKDFAYDGKDKRMAALGDGNLDFERIIQKAEEAETRFLLVEQDDCGGEDPFECLTRSYRYLRAMGL